MPVKTDGTLYAKTLKDRQVPNDQRAEAPDAPTGRFIGLGDLKGWDTRCRILEVTDAGGDPVNDAIDATVDITIEPLVDDPEVGLQPTDVQLRVGYDEGYFIDVVGVVPAGLPTSEHTPGARGLEHQTQEFMRDVPAADQSGIEPGRGALQDLAGAGEHGDPLPDEEKAERAREAEFQRVFAAELSKTPEDVEGAIDRAQEATGLKVEPATVAELPAAPTQEELEAAHARIFRAELEQTPDDPDRALAAANDATGLNVERITPQEPTRQDV